MARTLAWMLVLGMPSLLLGQTHSEISSWRALYRQTAEGGPADSAIVLMTEALQTHPNNAICTAFHATTQLQKAQELWNPLDKLTTFQTWRPVLDSALEALPLDPDLALLRLGVQSHTPGFLDYDQAMVSDTRQVREALAAGHWEDDPAHAAFVQDFFTYLETEK
jgi:hypothetical protein